MRKFKEDYLKFVFSYKLKAFRQRKKMSISDLAEKTKISISYISEIEKGLKYPKPERIAMISQALDVSFDDLVTVKLDEDMNYVSMILNSTIWNEFPFEQFGISIHEIFRLLTDSDNKAAAFIKTIYEIGKNYEMQGEHFLLAALRSFQAINNNYFPQVEEASEKFTGQFQLSFDDIRNVALIEKILKKQYGVEVNWRQLSSHPDLGIFRSVYKESSNKKKLYVNPALDDMQRAFVLLKEIAYQFMRLKERSQTFTVFQPKTFNEVYNNFVTSYFAGAALMKQEEIVTDLNQVFRQASWKPELFLHLLEKYVVTPETFLHRLSQILPQFFGFKKLHYMRFLKKNGEKPNLDRELNNTDVFTARGSHEHHCAKWLSVSSLEDFEKVKDQKKYGLYAQKSTFLKSNKEFFNFTICRTLNTNSDIVSSMTLGILNNSDFKVRVKFWDDPMIKRVTVNETCERCYLSEDECLKRQAPPAIYLKEQAEENVDRLLAEL